MTRVSLTRRYRLPALHILSAPSLSSDENFQVFGPCSRLHGHDYEIEVAVSGDVDPGSGLLISRDDMDRLVAKTLLDPFRGTNLSDHFRHTTGEALALEFYRILEGELGAPVRLESVRVRETAKNSFLAGPAMKVERPFDPASGVPNTN